VDTFTTALEPDEILTEVRVPQPAGSSGGTYLKMERKVGDFATVAAAIHLSLSGGTIERAGIGLTAVGAEHYAAPAAEAFLRGQVANEENIAQAASIAAENTNPTADQRGPADYKRHLAQELTARALRRAITRAQGGEV